MDKYLKKNTSLIKTLLTPKAIFDKKKVNLVKSIL